MILGAYGLPGLSVLELSGMLSNLGVTYAAVRQGAIVKMPGRMAKQTLFPVIFNGTRLFLRTQNKFPKSKIIALVLDNPYSLQHELGLTLAGATFTKKSVLFSSFTDRDLKQLLISCKENSESLSFTREPYSLVNEVLKDYSASSLSALQTFLYKIKDTDDRDFVSKVVKKWMTSDEQFSILEPKLKKYIPLKAIDNLKLIINSPTMKVFRTAVREAAVNPKRMAAIAKTHKVSSFDIKYLLSSTA